MRVRLRSLLCEVSSSVIKRVHIPFGTNWVQWEKVWDDVVL